MDPRTQDWSELIAQAYDAAQPGCRLCARDCNVRRTPDDFAKGAWCRAPLVPHINTEMVHMGEERELRPSHTIFFAGCNAKCSFCHAWEFAQNARNGVKVSPQSLAALIDRRRDVDGAKNVNFVGGEATLYLPFILETLSHLKAPQTVVWNSNMYYRSNVGGVLARVVDIYLADYKFGNDRCAQDIGGFAGYQAVLQESCDLAYRSGQVIVRHLLMPGHLDCCTQPTLDVVKARWPGATVNLMTHYLPLWKAAEGRYGELSRPATPDEAARANAMLDASGLVRA